MQSASVSAELTVKIMKGNWMNKGLERLRRDGFDQSRLERSTGYLTVRCSQCEAAVICGVACHEQGCPNAKNPCHHDELGEVKDESED